MRAIARELNADLRHAASPYRSSEDAQVWRGASIVKPKGLPIGSHALTATLSSDPVAQCGPLPIRPERRFFYLIDWAQLSAVIRFGRARGCSEGCGRPHGRWSTTSATAAGGTRRPIAGVTAGAGGSGSRQELTSSTWPVGSRRCWLLLIGITTPRTTRTPTSQPIASAAT